MNFNEWWKSDENPAHRLPDTTQVQVIDYMHAAFKAGEAKSIARLRDRGYEVKKVPLI